MRVARVVVMATRVGGNKEGDGDGNGKVVGDDDGDKGGGRATATRAMMTVTGTTWAMATAMRVAIGTLSAGYVHNVPLPRVPRL